MKNKKAYLYIAIAALIVAAILMVVYFGSAYARYAVFLAVDCDPFNDWLTHMPVGAATVRQMGEVLCSTFS